MSELVNKIRDALKRGHRFVTHGVWKIGMPGEEIPTGFIIKQIRVAILLGSKMLDGNHMVRASALAFATMLSIVPLLAVTFWVIFTFNLGEDLSSLVQDRMETAATKISGALTSDEDPAPLASEDFIEDEPIEEDKSIEEAEVPAPEVEDTVAGIDSGDPESLDTVVVDADADPIDAAELDENQQLVNQLVQGMLQVVSKRSDDSTDSADRITEFVEEISDLAREAATNSTAMTISGLLLVFTTVFGLMRNVENTFNRIWGVRRSRSWYRMFSDYVVVTLLLPFVAAVVIGVMAALRSEQIAEALGPLAFALRSSQLFMIAMVFTVLYKLVPSTVVRFKYALLAGVIAGILWVLLTFGYVQFQFGLGRLGTVYAVSAAIPMLLMWVYFSWAILLFGCEVSYAYQNESTFALERFADGATYAYKEAVGMRVMIEAGARFTEGNGAMSLEEMADSWNVPVRLLREILDCLIEGGYISECATEPVSYQPARPLASIGAGDVVNAVRELGEDPSLFRHDESFKPVFDELSRHENDFGGATIADLVEGFQSSQDAPAPSEPLNA